MPRVVHFELPADDPQRLASFYADVFGWKITSWDGPVEYLLVNTGDDSEQGIDGAILTRDAPVDATTNIVGVDDVDRFSQLVEDSGGEIVRPKTRIPGVGAVAYCRDPEGNLFGIFEFGGGPEDREGFEEGEGAP